MPRPKAPDPRLPFACRLRRETIAEIKRRAAGAGISEGAVIEAAVGGLQTAISVEPPAPKAPAVFGKPAIPIECTKSDNFFRGTGGRRSNVSGNLLKGADRGKA